MRNKAARIAVENTWLSLVSRSDDLIHHAGGAITFTGSGPRVTTIHDLQPLDLPANFSAVKRSWLRLLLPLTVKRSSKIVVPSNFTADRCRALLGATDDQLVVLPHGFEAETGGSVPNAVAGRRFLLSPGIAYPHKRHGDAISALAKLRELGVGDLALVFTGRPRKRTAALHEQAAKAGLCDVLFLGRVPASELAALYQAAACAVPSEYEGFGYPLLEAMANGCPVVTAAGERRPRSSATLDSSCRSERPTSWPTPCNRFWTTRRPATVSLPVAVAELPISPTP
ncbi:MAG: glycosyltransferase [Acidimicrobiales bacterium]